MWPRTLLCSHLRHLPLILCSEGKKKFLHIFSELWLKHLGSAGIIIHPQFFHVFTASAERRDVLTGGRIETVYERSFSHHQSIPWDVSRNKPLKRQLALTMLKSRQRRIIFRLKKITFSNPVPVLRSSSWPSRLTFHVESCDSSLVSGSILPNNIIHSIYKKISTTNSDIEIHFEHEMYCFTIAQGSATLCAMPLLSRRQTEYPGSLRPRFVSGRWDGG